MVWPIIALEILGAEEAQVNEAAPIVTVAAPWLVKHPYSTH
jgi:hypothetical protein